MNLISCSIFHIFFLRSGDDETSPDHRRGQSGTQGLGAQGSPQGRVEGRPHQRQDRLQSYLGLKFRFVAKK